jgi:hypothetical protein
LEIFKQSIKKLVGSNGILSINFITQVYLGLLIMTKAFLLNYWKSSTEKALKENVIKRLNARKRLN